MKSLLSILLFLTIGQIAFAQTYTVSGTIKDDQGKPVPFASILVKSTSKGTSANSEGHYALILSKGTHELLFKAIGYRQESRKINVDDDQRISIVLTPETYELQNVTIRSGGEDPAYAIIRKAIRKRKAYLNEVKAYTCETYIKGLQKLLAAPKKFMGQDINQIGRELGLDSNRKGIVYLSESESKYSFMQPNLVHEEMISSKVSGSNRAFSFNRASELNVNFYENLQNWEGISNRPLVSPIADNALSFYNYKWLGITIENGETINKIGITPKRPYEPAFTGYIYIIEDSWRIHSVDLELNKSAGINFADTIRVKQQYIPVANKAWMPSLVKFEFSGGLFGFRLGGYFLALYKNYDLNPTFDKHAFKEVMRVSTSVNKKDSTYWQQTRPIPLTDEEKTDYQKKEVLAQKRESKPYLDSLDSVYNKITPGKILLTGISVRNRYNKSYFNTDGLLGSLLYNTVEGVAINYGTSYSKQIDSLNNRYLRIGGKIRYGFSNQLLHGSLNATVPVNSYTWNFNVGSDVVDMNNTLPIPAFFNTASSLLYRRNYQKLYDKHFASVSLSRRISGGWQASITAEASERRWLDNTSYYSFFNRDRKYGSNNPLVPYQEGALPLFDRNQSFKVNISTSYNFSNRYVTYPSGRYYLPSRYPTVALSYTKGIKNIFGSDVDYDLLQASVSKDNINLGLYGNFSFYVGAGKFLNNKQLYYIDYKHFSGNQMVLYHSAPNAFLMLDYYRYSTSQQYLEAHINHSFGGVLLSKIPLIRSLKLQEVINANYLTTPDLKSYTELGVGIKYLSFRVLYGWSFNRQDNSKSAFRIDLNF
ncbi:carboxypeptidase-like regulatory domain-containing protein [Mucilaginibacter sp. Bleaf8]|uniref:DUF5686 and carboxypeptidase regulatory-like domain-containing protein n=1 Tax=Mucilaginibacter sp. Bleaf8 TaxID=2834430 RepID=UPI001BD05E78|nr:DUF5686 and carboxypeptidase regulatory-like domain-containing protein [Mucilaginibacter sp. Bleaf8]MBS7566308.1 carboxypeptidase-like regulatory domain-containing protein [Mucilaginibacter sp. Bleaf8]